MTADVDARLIWTLRDRDIAGNKLDPDNVRGGEVHPDLTRFQGWFYCIFNDTRAKSLIRSPDGEKWELVQRARCGQMFAHTPGGRLMTIGTSPTGRFRPNGQPYRQSHSYFSPDGVDWGLACYNESSYDTVLYTVTWHEDVAYSVGYTGKDQNGTLYRSDDAIHWEPIVRDFFPPERQGNEADLLFHDGRAYALLRGAYNTPVTIGTSQGPDFTDWSWQVPEIDWHGDGNLQSADDAIRAPWGGPKWLTLSDGRLIAHGRVLGPEPAQSRFGGAIAGGDKGDSTGGDEDAIVTLMTFDPATKRLTRLVDFPGYTHYHGIVEHDDQLWIACGRCDSGLQVWLLKTPVPN